MSPVVPPAQRRYARRRRLSERQVIASMRTSRAIPATTITASQEDVWRRVVAVSPGLESARADRFRAPVAASSRRAPSRAPRRAPAFAWWGTRRFRLDLAGAALIAFCLLLAGNGLDLDRDGQRDGLMGESTSVATVVPGQGQGSGQGTTGEPRAGTPTATPEGAALAPGS